MAAAEATLIENACRLTKEIEEKFSDQKAVFE